ncbi:hypothetical protein [uncultured Vibrio sp.]|uniref:hypothetical protein n=1 Tax=uncultured Vibrio sp. TaxID=114054 RepID=UPI0025F86153|nr:hypothetical protein [uncultured Vibrio sp.]
MKRIITTFLSALLFTSTVFACGFHNDTGLIAVPNHPGIMLTIPSIQTAIEDQTIPASEKPAAMINWQLAQKLSATKPNHDIIFYQAIDGHYSTVSSNNFRWLEDYNSETRPPLGALMILSEMNVFNALMEQQITIDQAFEKRWIHVNGPRDQREAVTHWLREAFAA